MNDNKEGSHQVQEINLFAKNPQVARFKKSVVVSVLLVAALFLFIIFSYLANNNPTPLEDVLDNELENAHWLAAKSSNNKPVNDPKVETQHEATSSEGASNQSLTIKPSQAQQLEIALNDIDTHKNSLEEAEPLGASKETDAVENANSAPIQVSIIENFAKQETQAKESITLSTSMNDTLPAGNYIPIMFLTEVNSELGGFALAQVVRSVFNSQRKAIVPQGAKILLQYETEHSGSRRLAFKATSLTLPNGKTFLLDNLPVVDSFGVTGIKDKSNGHVIRNFFAVAGNISSNQASQIVATQMNEAVMLPISSNNYFSYKGTTFYIRAGYECNLLLTHDLVIPNN